ncbi:MAG: rhodanese-like domain-containing protein [Gammaproteobacteria bacterium]|nr:rhodanese-like domain-containing protein [Gammaproteobacteria bacterium]
MAQFLEFVANHWLLWSAFFAVAFALVINLMLSGRGQVDAQALVSLINQENAVTVDVRGEADFKRGHILDALHIPLASLPERIKELEPHRESPVIVYCELGNVSPRAAIKLREAGFDNVLRLRGGLSAWRQASLPTVT